MSFEGEAEMCCLKLIGLDEGQLEISAQFHLNVA